MRPSHLIVNLDNLRHNFLAIKNYCSPAKIVSVVKANAYGHGLIPVAKTLEKAGTDFLGVAFLEEGIALREEGIKCPIVTLGGISGRQVDEFIANDIDILASSLSKLKTIEERAKALKKTARVHLKIDTGMERIGTHYDSPLLNDLISFAMHANFSELIGIETHFAESENIDQEFTALQLERFKESINNLKEKLPKSVMLHASNSGGIMSSKEYHCDMVRPGRILYGVSPAPHLDNVLDLKPTLELKSEVVFFKVVKKGATVSYGRTWTAEKDTRVVTIPLGYGDGLTRRLSNKGSVLINGKRYPIIGTVCMDQFMVDIGEDSAFNGDVVTIIGCDGNEKISVENMALAANAEPLELLTALNSRLPRIYIDENLASS